MGRVVTSLYTQFSEIHTQVKSGDGDQTSKSKIKNILNCLLHFYLFKSTTAQLLIDLVKILLESFTETDIEILIFILHNIGLQLRKEDPAQILSIIDMATAKKNTYEASVKMGDVDSDANKTKKISFLMMELQDIKNNKGAATL